MVTLKIKKPEFEAICSGQKKRDYRAPSLYNKRLLLKKNESGLFDRNSDIKEIKFENGYFKPRYVICEVSDVIPVKFAQDYTSESDMFTARGGENSIEIIIKQILKIGG